MLDPQYLQESSNPEKVEESQDSGDIIKTEFPSVFGPSISPISPERNDSALEQNKQKKESIFNNATKICLKFQLSNPPNNQGKTFFQICIRMTWFFAAFDPLQSFQVGKNIASFFHIFNSCQL